MQRRSHLDCQLADKPVTQPDPMALAPPTAAQPAHVSYSALDDYITCGKAYQLARVLELPPTPGLARAGGTAVHTATEVYDQLLYRATGR